MRLISLLLSILITTHANAQSVDLRIPNIPQETAVWCWVAVSEQIIRWKNGGPGPRQCELVSIANGYNGPFCCNPPNPMIYQNCLRTGGVYEIQSLIANFSGRPSRMAPPADPMTLFRTLQQGRAVILFVQSTPHAGHVIVLTGMSWMGGQPVLHINDPMSFFTQPVPFQALMGYWSGAIVVD